MKQKKKLAFTAHCKKKREGKIKDELDHERRGDPRGECSGWRLKNTGKGSYEKGQVRLISP